MSWSSCMRKKIIGHYGSEVENCVKSVTHTNWESILLCIVEVLKISKPGTWIAKQLAFFSAWSLECILGGEEPELSPETRKALGLDD